MEMYKDANKEPLAEALPKKTFTAKKGCSLETFVARTDVSKLDLEELEARLKAHNITVKDLKSLKFPRKYDEKGILIGRNKDLCDCLDDECEGCHFPYEICKNNKCGTWCRQNRTWNYDLVERQHLDGEEVINAFKY